MTPPVPTLAHALADRALRAPSEPAFRTLPAGGADAERVWSWADWKHDAEAIAAGLHAWGIRRGDRVAILAGNTPVWPLVDQAALRIGAVSVGIYPSSARVQVEDVLRDSGARILFVDSPGQWEKVRGLADGASPLDRIVLATLDGGGNGAEGETVTTLAELRAAGSEGVVDRLSMPGPDDDAILIYTSGSTGAPKGARLTHGTLVASAAAIRDTLGLGPGDRMLSYLPYSHAAERITGQATRILVGMEGGLVPDPGRVFEAAAAFRPTFFGALPRFYEKIWEAEVVERGPEAPAPSPVVERMTGGRVRIATSGGAVLPEEVARGLSRLGLTVLGAYGLTEHLCACFNRPGDARFDDVGPPMPGTEIRIADDGEILIRRSDLTFTGYHGRPDATLEAFTPDGEWLRTGDLGRLSPEGRLTVTGRRKELIALSTGKKVAPLPLEARLVERPWIAQAALVGEGRKFIGALVSLRRPVVEAWAREGGIDRPWTELCRDPRVRERVAGQVDEVNASVSRTESVRRFRILKTPFTVESGELTPTLKLRRQVIAELRAEDIEALYAESPS